MILHPIEIEYFKPSNRILKNPYMGFMTFNHFRGGKLFSNSVQGIYKERYPISEDVLQEGEKEGWHPECEVCYIRTCWRDFEPKERQYNFKFYEDIFNEAKKHKQHVIIRIMPHTTRKEEDVPEWLKAKIPCPERPDDKRVKESPTHPLFLQSFANAIKEFGKRFDNEPALYAMDISLFGAWGEGSGYEKVPKEEIENLMNIYSKYYKNTILLGQICAPELVNLLNENRDKKVGWRADGFGSESHVKWWFPKHTQTMKDIWKEAPVSLEAWWYMSEWDKNNFPDIDYLVDSALKYHVSTFNNKSSTIPFKWKDSVERLLKRMGYRFFIPCFFYRKNASSGDTLNCKFVIDNLGVAPIYTKHPLTFRIKNDSYEKVYNTNIDITKWMPGDSVEEINLKLDDNLKQGTYKIQIGLVGEYPTPTIYFANDVEIDNGYHTLCEIIVNEK